jgi:predicted nucleic acid-binding protein
MSTTVRFVDTNVLLYAISTANGERQKAERALAILDSEDLALSVQVLQEFYAQATRISKPDRLMHEQAVALIESWLRFRVQEVSVSILRNALVTRSRWEISYWDAAIIEAARAADCDTVLSEDLQDGMDFGGVRVFNPFQSTESD